MAEFGLSMACGLIVVLLVGPVAVAVANLFFAPLNWLQYLMQRPWRWLIKTPSEMNARAYALFYPLHFSFATGLYFIAFPLRFVNALYYDLCVYNLWCIRDHFAELVHPKRGDYRTLAIVPYCRAWALRLPARLLVLSLKTGLALGDSLAMVVVDLVFPTLTMYHGTTSEAANNIAQREWFVGTGNFAGTGLYFAMSRKAAEHYASSSGEIVCVRVSLGFNFPIACAPKRIREAVGRSGPEGDRITHWAQSRFITSVEHWRSDLGWWEYCLVRLPARSRYLRTWRVRPLFVVKHGGGLPHGHRILICFK